MIMATGGVVASGHYLATGIGVDLLRRGGNAMDAAAGVGFALALLKGHQNGIGGGAPPPGGLAPGAPGMAAPRARRGPRGGGGVGWGGGGRTLGRPRPAPPPPPAPPV